MKRKEGKSKLREGGLRGRGRERRNERKRTQSIRDKFYRYFRYAHVHAKILYKNFKCKHILLLPRAARRSTRSIDLAVSRSIRDPANLDCVREEKDDASCSYERETTLDSFLRRGATAYSSILKEKEEETKKMKKRKKQNDNRRIPKDSGAREVSYIGLG